MLNYIYINFLYSVFKKYSIIMLDNNRKILMSKELQEKADKMIKELQEALIPIRKEIVIKNIKNNNARKI